MIVQQSQTQCNSTHGNTVRRFNSNIYQRYLTHKQISELKKRLSDEMFLDDIGISRAQVFEQIKQLKKGL